MSSSLFGQPHRNGPWRLLVLDRDPLDPKWIIATVTHPESVRPALLDVAGRYTGWQDITAWVCDVLGYDVVLVPIHDSLLWRVDERERSR